MARSATPAYVKPKTVPPQQLEKIKAALVKARDLQMEISNGDTIQKQRREELRTLEFRTLPDLFNQAGVSNLGLDPDKNFPGYDASRAPYYHANIAANWDADKRKAAFDWLEKNGGGDLIKTEIVIQLPAKATALRKLVLKTVAKLKVPYDVNLAVPWASLTAFIKEYITKHKKMPPLETLGAEVGERVTMKPRKAA